MTEDWYWELWQREVELGISRVPWEREEHQSQHSWRPQCSTGREEKGEKPGRGIH